MNIVQVQERKKAVPIKRLSLPQGFGPEAKTWGGIIGVPAYRIRIEFVLVYRKISICPHSARKVVSEAVENARK